MCCKFNICKLIPIFIILLLIVLAFVVIISNENNGNKSILTAIAKDGDNTEIGNAIIKFSQNEIVEGTAISHQNGSSEIKINETGIYQISYQLFGISNTNGTFNFSAVILLNGTPLDHTLNSSPVLKENIVNNRMTLTSTVILRLNAGDIIQLGAVSLEDISYTSARIDIEKIG